MAGVASPPSTRGMAAGGPTSVPHVSLSQRAQVRACVGLGFPNIPRHVEPAPRDLPTNLNFGLTHNQHVAWESGGGREGRYL